MDVAHYKRGQIYLFLIKKIYIYIIFFNGQKGKQQQASERKEKRENRVTTFGQKTIFFSPYFQNEKEDCCILRVKTVLV